jgi:hypothetical protein
VGNGGKQQGKEDSPFYGRNYGMFLSSATKSPPGLGKQALVFFCFFFFSIPSHSRKAKAASSIPSHSSQAKTDFLHSKIFQWLRTKVLAVCLAEYSAETEYSARATETYKKWR